MNRFRSKKKGRDDASIGGRPSLDAESPGPFRLFGKKKTQDEEPRREVDLATVLPPSDDFRTSLLMTGLSARFSMLREQDDPHSKLGKASDDSVLFTKPQFRLVEHSGLGGGLHDIAEIESLKAPALGRFDPYGSDDASSTNGSVMSRAKPTEGNNLFGGRQKIYKLAAGSRAGMSGRALYDDDVAQSAFQKWRQTEKERRSLEEVGVNTPYEAESTADYNRRRETSSTSSSVPSAAASNTSQPSSTKDSQSAGNLPGLERSVTRTRRLYEQGLTQDLQGQQTSALSRMDTLSRQRTFGSRAPDTSTMPSPTASSFGDKSVERRQLLTKASAPNLRSFSASTNSSAQMSPPDSATKFPKNDLTAHFGSNPPLSPPISETGDHPALAIRPGDHGKATAMGMFSRPTMQYDESRYAQRQRQLQQTRDASLSRRSDESTSSSASDRSRSSSAQRTSTEKLRLQRSLSDLSRQNEDCATQLLDESDDGSVDRRRTRRTRAAPPLTIERPRDLDHPAFRKSALPTPLSISSPKDSDDHSPFSPYTPAKMPGDSPTLGPTVGLSGMVRQHLRTDSTASSVYGPLSHDMGFRGTDLTDKLSPRRIGLHVDVEPRAKNDDFAQYLADGAKRVRERLTTYVESDNDRSAPPTPPLSEKSKEHGFSKSSGLGILGSKSSRGSLADKVEKERGRAKVLMAGVGSHVGTGTSPSPRKISSGSRRDSQSREDYGKTGQPNSPQPEENMHVGLKAFRQARRELQKMKELEVQQRHTQRSASGQDTQLNNRAAIVETGPPPALFSRMPREDQNYKPRSRAGSRATSERDRSGSEASTGGRGYSHGARRGSGMESPVSSPYKMNGAAGMSPSHSAGAFESSGRYYAASGMHSPKVQDPEQCGRSRNGSLLSAAASTPNLHGSASAPPLPPINPRRKAGHPRGVDEEGRGAGYSNGIFGVADAFGGDGKAATENHRGLMHGNGPLRQSPPRIIRQPPPHVNISNATLPGGMI